MQTLQGIWSLTVSLSGSSFTDSQVVTQLVFQLIFAIAIIFAWVLLPSRAETNQNPTVYSGILFGVYCLMAWYVLTLFDLIFHETRLQVAYGYIFIYLPILSVKFAADILILSATHRMVSVQLYDELRKPILWVVVGEFQTFLLLMTALYYLGSLCAHETLWLNVADSDVIDDVAGHKDQFEVAFCVIQFLFTLFTLAGSITSGWILYRRGYHFMAKSTHMMTATAFLWIRSISELVVAAHYHLERNEISSSALAARDFVYGLCTLIFLLQIAYVARDITSAESMDPVLKTMREECHQHVINSVQDYTNTLGHAPTLTETFQRIRQDPNSALTQATAQAMLGRTSAVVAYMDKLEGAYGDLRPW